MVVLGKALIAVFLVINGIYILVKGRTRPRFGRLPESGKVLSYSDRIPLAVGYMVLGAAILLPPLLGYYLFFLMFIAYSVLCIIRPSVAAGWAKGAHPEFAGYEAPLLRTVKLIGVGGLLASAFFVLSIIRDALG